MLNILPDMSYQDAFEKYEQELFELINGAPITEDLKAQMAAKMVYLTMLRDVMVEHLEINADRKPALNG